MSMQWEAAVKVCISIQASEMTSKLPHSTYCSKKLFHQSPIAFSQWWVLKPNIRLPWSVIIIESNAVTANFRTFLESISLITTVDFSFPHVSYSSIQKWILKRMNRIKWLPQNKENFFLPPYPSYDKADKAQICFHWVSSVSRMDYLVFGPHYSLVRTDMHSSPHSQNVTLPELLVKFMW